MVQFNILSGKMAGNQTIVRHFPFRVGRSDSNDLKLDDDGVWNEHLTLDFSTGEKYVVQAATGALVSVNHENLKTGTLRNGDLISVGSVKIQFWLAATHQRSLKLRETLVWGLLAAVTLFQLLLIYQLNS
jgi:pSer/pThr/pTyr-binding forkhead associated (FHA) protein